MKLNKSRLLCYALCFLLPALVLTAAYVTGHFYPFGDKSILISDMSKQYVEFFCALKQGDVFFSWSKALGTSYIGVFSYYVSSPLSLLTLLVPNEAMPFGLMLLTILKLGLAGLTFSIFSAHYFQKLNGATVLCSVCYALCAYAINYSLCIMWLDGLIWLPLILLGIERLMDGKGRWPLAVCLVLCFISTWYISYMIGLFCCLWFLFRACARGMDRRQFLLALRDFLLTALWALCLTAWLWLPSFLAMFNGKMAGPTAQYQELFNFSLPRLLPQFFYGQVSYINNTALPLIFCGSITIPAAAAWFFLRSTPLRERLAAAGVAAVLLLSLWLSPLDQIWHLFKRPNWFPYRYAFLISFFLVFLAQHVLLRLLDSPHVTRLAAAALTAVVCLEMGLNTRNILLGIEQKALMSDPNGGYTSYSSYVSDYRANAALVSAAEAEGDGFYRIGATADRGLNSPLAFGYNGITHYSSLYSSRVNAALKSLGFAQGWYWCVYYGSTHFTDALLDIRYVISDQAFPGYSETARADGLTLWENPSTLPLVFLAEDTVAQSGELSPIALQNALFSALSGEDRDVFLPASPEVAVEGDTTTLTFTGTGQPIYLDLTSEALLSLSVDGQFTSWLNTGETRHLYCLGAPEPGRTLTAVISHTGAWDPSGLCYYLDHALLTDTVEQLNNTQVTKVTNSAVKATAQADADRVLVTTIPAEPGWTAYVDGRKADTYTWLDDCFLALDVPAGQHEITLRYTAPGLYPGLALGGLALLAAVLPLLLRRKKQQ